MVTRRLACDRSSAQSHNCSRQDSYAFASVCGLETFVLSDRMYTCFSFLHNTHAGSLCIPLASSLLSVLFTLPLLLCLNPFSHMFRSFISCSTIHSWSFSVLQKLGVQFWLSPRAWITWSFVWWGLSIQAWKSGLFWTVNLSFPFQCLLFLRKDGKESGILLI